MNKIYISSNITGYNPEERRKYFNDTEELLISMNYKTINPYLSQQIMDSIPKENHKELFFNSNLWMVKNCDILYANLLNTIHTSLGVIMELAWAKAFNKFVVLVVTKDNLHYKKWILQTADIIFENEILALDFLKEFRRQYV